MSKMPRANLLSTGDLHKRQLWEKGELSLIETMNKQKVGHMLKTLPPDSRLFKYEERILYKWHEVCRDRDNPNDYILPEKICSVLEKGYCDYLIKLVRMKIKEGHALRPHINPGEERMIQSNAHILPVELGRQALFLNAWLGDLSCGNVMRRPGYSRLPSGLLRVLKE